MTTTNTALRSNPAPSTSETEGAAEVTELASESVQQLLPEAFARYYPRKYLGVGGWASPKVPAAVFAMEESIQTTPTSSIERAVDDLSASIRGALTKLSMPTYWVSADLADAVVKTVPPDIITADDLQMPLPAALFLLPKKTLTLPDGADASWMAVGKNPLSPRKEDSIEEHFCVATGTPGLILFSVIRAEKRYAYRNDEYVELDKNGNYLPGPAFADSSFSDNATFCAKMRRMGVNLTMMLTAFPKLAEETTRVSFQKPHTDEASLRPCSPNWIGQTIKLAGQ